MSRTGQIRQILLQYLSDGRTASFDELKIHVNRRLRHGTTSNQLSNVLAKDTRFQNRGMTRVGGLSGIYKVTTWKLAEAIE